MDLKNLAIFCKVVSEGSMTVAADKLSITQPAVSQKIRQLEKEFEVKLLVRNVRQVRPTVQGQILFEHATQILNLIQKTKTAIQTILLDVSGEEIKATSLNSIGLYLISPVIGNFLKLSPQMQLSLLYGTGDDIIRRMVKDEVDLAIIHDLKKEHGREFSGFKQVHLFKDHIYFVKSSKLTVPSINKPLKIEEIVNQRFVQMKGLYPAFENLLSNRLKEKNIKLKASFQSDNVGTLKRVIESGLGWGFLPAHSIRKQLKMGRFSIIPIENLNYEMDVNLYYKPGNEKKEKIIQAFRMIIQKEAQVGF